MKKMTLATLTTLMGVSAGSVITAILKGKTIKFKQGKVDKFKSYYNMLNQWLMLKQEGKSLETYFIENDYKCIAIYGMGEMGNRLYDELKESSVNVKYAIDKNANSAYAEVEVYDLEDDLEKVDVVVVTAVFAFDEIKKIIEDKLDFKIISLEDVIYEL